MAIKDIRRRIDRMERRFLVQPQSVSPESHAALARELKNARMILRAELEAHRLLDKLYEDERNGRNYGCVYSHPREPEDPAEARARREPLIKEREAEIADLERRCAEAGLSEEDIERLGG